MQHGVLKRVLALAATFWMSVGGAGLAVRAAENETVRQATNTAASMPTVSAASAVLYEPQSGTVLFEKGAHDTRAMASTTKLMTALLADERLRWEDTVRVPAAASGIEGTTLGLAPNEVISVGDLVTGMLLESGNDAATALALLCDGSVEAFAARMNKKAAALGMKSSHFVTPSGLDAPGHETTALDMARLGAAVLERPRLAAVCAKRSAVIHLSGRAVTVCNHNRLLSMVDGCVGLKTGYTDRARRCLVSAVKRDGVTLVAVTLNGHDYWKDHAALYEAGFPLVKAVTLKPPRLSSVAVAGGKATTAALSAARVCAVLTADAREADISYEVRVPALLFAPIQKGQAIGTICYRYCGRVIATAAVTAQDAVPKAAKRPTVCRIADVFFQLFGAMLAGG